MDYNQQIFKKFRALAVTDPTAILPGKTYWGNWHDKFTVDEVLTDREHKVSFFKDLNLENDPEALALLDDVEPRWVRTTEGATFSLYDNNIGRSYNPWLIFECEQLANECRQALVISFGTSSWDEDDYGYSGVDDDWDDFWGEH